MHANRSLILVWIALAAPRAKGVEVATDASGGRDFIFLTTDVKQFIVEDRLALSAGYAVVSDLRGVRHGGRGAMELEFGSLSVAALVSFAPAQERRGWLSLTIDGSHRWEGGRFVVESEASVLLRRAGAQIDRLTLDVDQLQAEAAVTLTVDGRAHLGVSGLLSFYDPDLAQPSLRGLDAGLFITVAGRPERFAISAHSGVRFADSWEFLAALTGAAFADGRGGAWLPRVGLRAGPWAGFTVEAATELAIGLGAAAGDPLRLLGALALEWER